ncbi:phosphatase 2C-like domain-containing protein [Mycena pura]|uniref:Phosphatase 2C-like domain-containing protein n=1 Tax=Mycena pura TaxID=153505 RepID=A0AAD6UV57_9AGAR|nr:phosphatase 2C-like domain-containing protein [Mycena pura]
MSSWMDLRAKLAQLATQEVRDGIHFVALNGCGKDSLETQDRYYGAEWNLSNGLWKLVVVLDGHGVTHSTVDFILDKVPSMVKEALVSALRQSNSQSLDDDTLSKVLSEPLISLDNFIKDSFLSLLPSDLSNFDPTVALRDESGNMVIEVDRCVQGSTAAVALIDPSKRIHVANIGDCDAFLYSEMNGLGDMHYKLPVHLVRILGAAWGDPFGPGLMGDRNNTYKTPPYMSNLPEVAHAHVEGQKFLIVASDGLDHLLRNRFKHENPVEQGKICGAAAARALESESRNALNLAGVVLWEAYGGDGDGNIFGARLAGELQGRVDDVAIAVVPL